VLYRPPLLDGFTQGHLLVQHGNCQRKSRQDGEDKLDELQLHGGRGKMGVIHGQVLTPARAAGSRACWLYVQP
jgi:hypothetical protein